MINSLRESNPRNNDPSTYSALTTKQVRIFSYLSLSFLFSPKSIAKVCAKLLARTVNTTPYIDVIRIPKTDFWQFHPYFGQMENGTLEIQKR